MALSLLKQMLPNPVKDFLRNFRGNYLGGYSLKSYSQEGEDLILSRLFETKTSGFYVDVGAHHPKRFSNTYLFYKKGWRGINIDAMPGSMSEFKKFRPRDINIESAVGTEKEIPFYVFEEKALNTFDAKLAEERIDLGWRLLRKENIQVTPLREILKKSMPEETIIDLLSVDVEGLDLEVLESNDWARFRPKCIAIEILNTSLHSLENNPIHVFLKEKGYTLRAKTENTGIYTNY